MICFSSTGRIRLNSIIVRGFVPPPPPPDICCSGHSTLCGNGMPLLTENKKRMCRRSRRASAARSALICLRISGPQKRLINTLQGALELESWRSESDNPCVASSTKEGQELNSQFEWWNTKSERSRDLLLPLDCVCQPSCLLVCVKWLLCFLNPKSDYI